jgi:hypothetical protein
MSRRSVRGYVDVLSRHPLRPLFSERLEANPERQRIRPYLHDRQRMQALDAWCRFGLWYERYRDRLEPLDLDQFRTIEPRMETASVRSG